MKSGRRLIAHYLRKRREDELGITQFEIARRMRLESHMFISLIERAMCPVPAERVRDIAQAYEIDEANCFLWFSVARWIDEEVPLNVILYIINLPADEPEGVVDPPGTGAAPRPTGGRGTEREVDSFLQRLLRHARVNGKAAQGRVTPLLRRIHSVLVPFLVLIRSILARMKFLSSLIDIVCYILRQSLFPCYDQKEFSFFRGII